MRDLFTDDFKPEPYWWDRTPRPKLSTATLPPEADVAVVGAGYTGLSAALQTARAGRHTVVFDAEAAGWGCSSRNGGQIGDNIKPSVAALAKRLGADRAKAIHREGRESLDWLEAFTRAENIDCDLVRVGRFHAAHTPRHYEALARGLDPEEEAFAVPRAEQRSELGTDAYHGGVVYPHHASVDPARLHAGFLAAAERAGAAIHDHCPVLAISRDGDRFRVTTAKGEVRARDVILATNGYSGPLNPWARRRVIPIGSYIMATEPLPRETVDRLFPTNRVVSDTCKVIYYYRASPDRTRILFGGRVSARETDPRVSAPRLHRDLARVFPELGETRVARSWMGFVAFTFDELPHTGVHEGIHYAMGYCGTGVALAGWLGMKLGEKVLRNGEGRTAFDDLPFPSRAFYSGVPWFLPPAVAAFRIADRLQWRAGG
jgi:glycine/D-amino acid oxidase-like deaminating enzyme